MVFALALGLGSQGHSQDLLVRAGRILTMAGPPVHGGAMLVRDGVIAAVGAWRDVDAPTGVPILDCGDATICPGFVDLHHHVSAAGQDLNDMVLPTNPELRTLDAVRPSAEMIAETLRGGVTTTLFIPGSGTNLSGFGVLLSMAGDSLEEMVIRELGAMKVAQGYNPERRSGDLGVSRMGMHQLLTETLEKGRDYTAQWQAHAAGNGPRPELRPELEQLRAVFERRVPVLIHTAGARDCVATARMFQDVFKLWMILSHGTFDGWWAAHALAARGTPVNLGPRMYDLDDDGHFQGIAAGYWNAGCVDLVDQHRRPRHRRRAARPAGGDGGAAGPPVRRGPARDHDSRGAPDRHRRHQGLARARQGRGLSGDARRSPRSALPPHQDLHSRQTGPRTRRGTRLVNPRHLVVAALALPFAAAGAAQERAVAIVDARILTLDGDAVERGTLVMRDGKIEAVGADVDVPAGAVRIDGSGHTVMPGLVSAFSRAGLVSAARSSTRQSVSRRGRFRGVRPTQRSTPAKNEAAKKVADEVYARQEVFGQLLRAGVTTIGVAPRGDGLPGRGAVLDPGRGPAAEVADDDAFVMVAPRLGSKNKKMLRDALEAAEKIVEERSRPPEAKAEEGADEQKTEAKPADGEKPGEGDEPVPEGPPTEEPKPAEGKEKEEPKDGAAKPDDAKKKAEKKKDPNLEVLADLLQGKRRALVQLGSANDLVHFLDVVGETRLQDTAFVAPSHGGTAGRLDEVVDRLADWKAPVLTTRGLTTATYGAAQINPAALLSAAGIDVGFILDDSPRALRSLFFDLMESVRYGMPRDKALAAVTRVPASALGIDDRVGTLSPGKAADVLMFRGDPLDPTSRLARIWHKGVEVEDVER